MQEVIYNKDTMKVPVKIWATNLEQAAREQSIRAASLPCIFHHLSIMADGHYCPGGVPVGSVLVTKEYVVPGAAGSDIGCGVIAWNSGVHKSNLDIKKLMLKIKDNINLSEYWEKEPVILNHPRFQIAVTDLTNKYAEVIGRHKSKLPDINEAFKQTVSLGGGNHFYEIQEDKDGIIWIMIHSGSRNFGARVATKYIKKAQDICTKYFTPLPDKELAFLHEDSDDGRAYVGEMELAQKFALYNRLSMLIVGQDAIAEQFSCNNFETYTNIPHNYTRKESHYGENVWVHRKGSTLATKDTVGIIPGSMCSKSFIVKGKENQDSYNSCSHGAGRNFSRTVAKKRIADGLDPSQSSQLGNVELYGVTDAHDELGSAYKNVDTVMKDQEDLVEIQIELKPIAVLKA